MTEETYQQEIQELWTEMQERGETLIDYLVSQPPIKLARIEVRSILEWALAVGAEHPDLVKERLRRRELSGKRSHVSAVR